jgi:uncharacterized Fe-S cluster protein YjdI
LTVTFDARRCIHAAECVRRLPEVFDPAARPWVRPERAVAEQVIEAVHRCPTGALRVVLDGAPVEIAVEGLQVKASRHGPLTVRGDVRLVTEDGTEIARDTRVALCRCGQSRRQPLCDGSHRAAGFRDPAR